MPAKGSTAKQVPCVCAHCGKSFTAYASKVANGRARFCGKACYRSAGYGRRPVPVLDRLWPKVLKAGLNECWLWQGGTTQFGYGTIGGPNQTLLLAHRVSYEAVHGPIPAGMFVLHRCDVPACVNPAHLFLGTPRDNTHDMIQKGRKSKASAKGDRNGHAKLTDDQVREIRASTDPNDSALARQYGVSPTAVALARKGKTWRHI